MACNFIYRCSTFCDTSLQHVIKAASCAAADGQYAIDAATAAHIARLLLP